MWIGDVVASYGGCSLWCVRCGVKVGRVNFWPHATREGNSGALVFGLVWYDVPDVSYPNWSAKHSDPTLSARSVEGYVGCYIQEHHTFILPVFGALLAWAGPFQKLHRASLLDVCAAASYGLKTMFQHNIVCPQHAQFGHRSD